MPDKPQLPSDEELRDLARHIQNFPLAQRTDFIFSVRAQAWKAALEWATEQKPWVLRRAAEKTIAENQE